jgi:hypothetical protein
MHTSVTIRVKPRHTIDTQQSRRHGCCTQRVDADELRCATRPMQLQAIRPLTQMPMFAVYAASAQGAYPDASASGRSLGIHSCLLATSRLHTDMCYIQSASSYECDGCSHHASFHNMENKAEDEIRKRWEQEAKDKADQDEAVQPRPMKRVRTIEYQSAMASGGLLNMLGSASSNNSTATRGRGAAPKRPNRTAATRARGKVTEAAGEEDDDDDAVVEID